MFVCSRTSLPFIIAILDDENILSFFTLKFECNLSVNLSVVRKNMFLCWLIDIYLQMG